MAEKEETITVAVRLPASHVMTMRTWLAYEHGRGNYSWRNMSDVLRDIVAEAVKPVDNA